MSSDPPTAAPPAPPAATAAPPAEPESQPPLPPRQSQQPQDMRQSYYNQYPNAYGQPFQTYHQYGAGTAPVNWSAMQQPPPGAQFYQHPPLIEKKPWVMSKMVLHAIGFVFGIIILALGISFVNDWQYSLIYLIMNCTLGGMAIIWSATELIVRSGHKFNKGVHPGAHVGLCLIIWLAAAIVGGFEAALAFFENIYSGDYYYSSYYCSSSYNYDTSSYEYDDDCYDESTGRRGIMIAVTVFSWFMWLIYFVLFVLACIDTSRLNAHNRQPLMVVPGPAQWGSGGPEMGAVPPSDAWQAGQGPAVPSAAAAPVSHRQSVRSQHRASGQVASGALHPIEEKGKEPEQPSNQNVREYYNPGTAA